MTKPRVRTLAPEEWKIYRDLRLRALADAPDAFGRTLAEEQGRPDHEWSNRLSSGVDSGRDLPLVAEVEGEPIGLAWGRIEGDNPEVVNLYQMWVAPSHRRLGAGQMLLEAVIAWAQEKDTRYLDLGVTLGNRAAIRLYSRTGFEAIGEPQSRQGAKLSSQLMRLKLGSGAR